MTSTKTTKSTKSTKSVKAAAKAPKATKPAGLDAAALAGCSKKELIALATGRGANRSEIHTLPKEELIAQLLTSWSQPPAAAQGTATATRIPKPKKGGKGKAAPVAVAPVAEEPVDVTADARLVTEPDTDHIDSEWPTAADVAAATATPAADEPATVATEEAPAPAAESASEAKKRRYAKAEGLIADTFRALNKTGREFIAIQGFAAKATLMEAIEHMVPSWVAGSDSKCRGLLVRFRGARSAMVFAVARDEVSLAVLKARAASAVVEPWEAFDGAPAGYLVAVAKAAVAEA